MQSLQKESYNPVNLNKPIGNCETVEQLPDTIKCNAELFILSFQTESQKEILELGSKKILFVDATYNTTQYGFYLTNLLVPDENYKGYPVGHIISNKLTTKFVDIFFQAIRDRCPSLEVNALMTDDDNCFWNGFQSVFGTSTIHLLCHWHV